MNPDSHLGKLVDSFKSQCPPTFPELHEQSQSSTRECSALQPSRWVRVPVYWHWKPAPHASNIPTLWLPVQEPNTVRKHTEAGLSPPTFVFHAPNNATCIHQLPLESIWLCLLKLGLCAMTKSLSKQGHGKLIRNTDSQASHLLF